MSMLSPRFKSALCNSEGILRRTRNGREVEGWIVCALLYLLSVAILQAQAQQPTWQAPPKLVVGIVVDQMRPDYIYRYWDNFGAGGFKRLVGEGAFLLSVAGVAVMFVLNLSVSFLLALISAARAYELRAHDNSELLHGLLRRFRRTPLDFFVSPRADRAKTEAPARA